VLEPLELSVAAAAAHVTRDTSFFPQRASKYHVMPLIYQSRSCNGIPLFPIVTRVCCVNVIPVRISVLSDLAEREEKRERERERKSSG